ncbi:MAG: undecaprenyl/decaprenyl-phosphate alpha-N-acetylglucosaminyl 1-phosphate transferase, partial [Candidatus Cloacimonetes bacterium]|nr:undecaprenyl/decaprenyl-phosphate alpha-N-acetylglucosaminyl 1-phosphate transferase [Candidatus Cloacimonadota bacterium]
MKYLISILFTFIITYILVPLNIKLSNRINLIDQPHQRGLHKNPIPVGGGLSFGIPIIIIQILGYFLFGTQMLYLAIGSFLILLLGFLDDKTNFTANYKLLFQIFIVSLIYFWGFKIELLTNPFGEALKLGILSYPITVLWFLIVVNAFNLIDGLDGLASGIALISASVLFAVGFVKSNEIIMFLSLSIIGANAAFLRYNFFPAKIFMGDTGSLLLGFNIAAISIAGEGEFKGITSMTLLVPIIILAFPLMDIFFAIIRRMKMKKHIFQADKEHIHHKLYDMGISQKNVALVSYFITLLFGLIAFG